LRTILQVEADVTAVAEEAVEAAEVGVADVAAANVAVEEMAANVAGVAAMAANVAAAGTDAAIVAVPEKEDHVDLDVGVIQLLPMSMMKNLSRPWVKLKNEEKKKKAT
jgi:hypothetical protein